MHTKINKELQAKIRARQARKGRIQKNGAVRAYVAMIAIVALLFGFLPEVLFT